MDLAAIAQGQLDAYNRQDLDAHVSYFADDMTIANLREEPNLVGVAAYRERMGGVFAQFPQNRVELLSRTFIGNHALMQQSGRANGKVLDHEKVMRAPDVEPFEVIAIYTIENGQIKHIDFVK